MPDSSRENLRSDGVEAEGSQNAGRNHAILVKSYFKMQVRIADTRAAREGERVALAVRRVRRQFHVVLVGRVLFFADLDVQFAETALVRKNPCLAALALVEHDLAVTERACADFLDAAVFRGQDGPALFHVGRVVDACVVARAPVLSKGGCQVSVLFKGGVAYRCVPGNFVLGSFAARVAKNQVFCEVVFRSEYASGQKEKE